MHEYLILEEVADKARTKPSTLRAWRRQGKGPKSVVVAGRLLYRRSDVDAWLAAQFDEVAA